MEGLVDAIAKAGVFVAYITVLSVAVEAVVTALKPWTGLGLQRQPEPSAVLNDVLAWLTSGERDKAQARLDALDQVISDLEQLPGAGAVAQEGSTATRAAATQAAYQRGERNRVTRVRLWSVAIGIGLAVAFGIDTLALLGGMVGAEKGLLASTFGGVPYLGAVLSGIAASAGSSFWHDQSKRLRLLKEAAANLTGEEQSSSRR